jgi:hypothetical protein
MKPPMNIIRKKRHAGSINRIWKAMRKEWNEDELDFPLKRLSSEKKKQMLVVCGRVGSKQTETCRRKAEQLGIDFVEETGRSWIHTKRTLAREFVPGHHSCVLLIGDNKALPGTQISYAGGYAYTDWFLQDVDNDGCPEVPVGRVFGSSETVLYHMDPRIVDSNIAVVFDSEPGRSDIHVRALADLGFDVQVLESYRPDDALLLSASEFVLQFSDGMYECRIHGTPERWASHNSVILSHKDASAISFKGYPVVFSEACNTAQEGPLLRAFLDQGACYVGASLDTLNNFRPFDNWRFCAYADGWKYGFMDLLDSYCTIGEVKVNVEKEMYAYLAPSVKKEVEALGAGDQSKIESDEALTMVEWLLFGNPLRKTTVGLNADYRPTRIPVDT